MYICGAIILAHLPTLFSNVRARVNLIHISPNLMSTSPTFPRVHNRLKTPAHALQASASAGGDALKKVLGAKDLLMLGIGGVIGRAVTPSVSLDRLHGQYWPSSSEPCLQQNNVRAKCQPYSLAAGCLC
jgi:hypothetical protein